MQPPKPADMRHLRPRHRLAWLHITLNLLLIGGGLAMSILSPHPVAYGVSQVLLALGFTQAFVLMHEAGHHTLFRHRWLNDVIGIVAGFIALIPYATWRPIHSRHHRYTGWQDLDATTASLVPRRLARWEQIIIDSAWRFWLPLFSVLYRLQNYWFLRRLSPFLGSSVSIARLRLLLLAQLLFYGVLMIGWGFADTLVLLGPGLFLALMAQDLILLSQHTYMPTHHSQHQPVRPFSPIEQGPFTRSLRLPGWLSCLLLHFDAHELHHLYPAVPGYLLRRIPYSPPNEVSWLTWLQEVKRLSGTQFLFGGPRMPEENA